LEQEVETRSAIQSVLIYPALLASAGTLAIVLLVVFVLPRFAAILTDLGQTIPATAQIILGFASFARFAIVPLSICIAIAVVGLRAWIATQSGRESWHRLLLALPILGPIRQAFGASRSCDALAALLAAGVPMRSALTHAASASGDSALGQRFVIVSNSVARGDALASALASTKATTPTIVRLVQVGQHTGELAKMLFEGARLERERATRRVSTLVKLLEPSLILAFGVLMALISAALLQTIYAIRPT